MSGPCCSCLSITYTAAPTGDGFVRDCWSCDSCGCEFVRRPPQADTPQASGESAGVDIFEDPSKAVCEHWHLRRVCSECEATATLAARDAEIERLKDKAIRFDLDQIGIESRERDAVELVEARTEIERLKALVEYNSSLVKAWRALVMSVNRHLEEEFEMNDKSQSEIERLNALVDKRERQLVWALRACGDDEALKFYGLDIIAMSDYDAGLLAAIDEATRETPDQR